MTCLDIVNFIPKNSPTFALTTDRLRKVHDSATDLLAFLLARGMELALQKAWFPIIAVGYSPLSAFQGMLP